jgi:chromosome segregation protein
LIDSNPSLTLVSAHGDVLTRSAASGGNGAAGRLHIVAALEQAEADQQRIDAAVQATATALAAAEDAFRSASEADAKAKEEFQAARSSAADHNAAVALANSRLDGAKAEAERARKALEQAQASRVADEATLAGFGGIEAHEALDPSTSEEFSEQFDVEALRSAVIEARQAETQARLAVRTAEERIAAYESRAKDLQATASAEREARASTSQRRPNGDARRRSPQRSLVAAGAVNQLETAVAKSAARRHQLTSLAQSRTQELSTLRTTIRELTDKIEKLTTDVHRDEIARAEQRLRVEQLETKSSRSTASAPKS